MSAWLVRRFGPVDAVLSLFSATGSIGFECVLASGRSATAIRFSVVLGDGATIAPVGSSAKPLVNPAPFCVGLTRKPNAEVPTLLVDLLAIQRNVFLCE